MALQAVGTDAESSVEPKQTAIDIQLNLNRITNLAPVPKPLPSLLHSDASIPGRTHFTYRV